MAAEILDMFFNGFHPSDPKFYYYKIHDNRKTYYMINKDKYSIVRKDLIPPGIIDNISEFDPIDSHMMEKKQLDDLDKKCATYSKKIDGCIAMKKLLKKEIKLLIITYGEGLDYPWYANSPQCYYRHPGKKPVCYSYKDHRTVEDINLRRELILYPGASSKKILNPVRKIAKSLPFPCELVCYFDEKWLIWSKKDQIDNLMIEIDKIKYLFNKTKKQMEILNFGIDLFLDEGVDTNQKFYENRQKEKQLRKDFEKAKNEKFGAFFERAYSWYVPPKAGTPHSNTNQQFSNQTRSNRDVLVGYGIHDKKEWKEWLRKHHPDKGGNPKDCQEVITRGREMGY